MSSFPALSKVASLSDVALISLHDRVHSVADNHLKSFIEWYHAEIVELLTERSLVHRSKDNLDDTNPEILDFEIATEKTKEHFHTAMLAKNGQGFTDPVDSHFHVIRDGKILESEGHTHELQLSFKIEKDKNADESLFRDALTKSFQESATVQIAKTSDQDEHNHLAVIFDKSLGIGVTTFENGHLHLIEENQLLFANDHYHILEKDRYEIPDLSQLFRSIMPQEEAENKKVVIPKATDNNLGNNISANELKIVFNEPTVIPSKIQKSLSTENAWKMWGSTGREVLLTSWFPGVALEAHVDASAPDVEVRLFLAGKDVSNVFRGVRDSLKLLEPNGVSQFVLTGNLTGRFEKSEGVEVVQNILGGSVKDGVAAWYVEDCVFYDVPLVETPATQRRHLMEKLLARAATPVLHHLPRALKQGEEAVTRVTEKSLAEGAAFVRWRFADSTLEDDVAEMLVGVE